MKKLFLLLPLVCVLCLLAACWPSGDIATDLKSPEVIHLPPSPTINLESKATIEVMSSPTPALLEVRTVPPTPIPLATSLRSPDVTYLVPDPTPSATANTPRMYSSYAYMVSFNAGNGLAEFDYFDLLQGDAAVAYLVEDGCYTQAEAEQFVNNMADSEFLVRNVNPQLRTFNLISTPIWMLPYPDGYDNPAGTEPVFTNYMDLCSIYAYNHDLLLDSFFYYVTVDSDETVEIRQVWWP